MKKCHFAEKLRILKIIKNFHEEELLRYCKELERAERIERKEKTDRVVRCTSLSGGSRVDGSSPVHMKKYDENKKMPEVIFRDVRNGLKRCLNLQF